MDRWFGHMDAAINGKSGMGNNNLGLEWSSARCLHYTPPHHPSPTMTSYTLYGHENTASTGIHWLLIYLAETAGVKFEFKTVDIFHKQEQKQQPYLDLNAKGRIPTLVAHTPEGDVTVTESGAIALLLADEHGLRPAPSAPLAQRARFDEALIFVCNSVLPALRDWMYAAKDGDEAHAHGVRLMTLNRLQNIYKHIDGKLAHSKYLASDDRPTAVDFLFDATLSWDGFIYYLSRKGNANLERYDEIMRATKDFDTLQKAEDLTITKFKDWEEPYAKLL